MRRREFLSALAAAPALAQSKPRLRRADSFFGLHFDLHPGKDDTVLGRDLTDAMAERLIERVRPDYIQYDCKGHAGYLGFVSQTGPSSPGIVKDSLEIWRRATAKHGVALYIHFSGVWDSAAVAEHPEWARVKPDGTPDDRQTSTFGPYVDLRMIPQLKEAAERYSLDGVWVDGECWSTGPDYSPAAARAFGAPLPKRAGDPRWLEFLEFNRARFRQYVKHYADALHAAQPQFQIASNWLYTTFVPEKPELPVDFLSGDYLGNASIATARLDARYLAATGKPWDLMAWGFQRATNSPVGEIHKPAVQLMQEAAVVLAQGGGFQVYYQPTRAGYFDDRLVGAMEEVSRFCRARQPLCHQTETIRQIGLLFSKHSLYATSNKLFGGWPAKLLDPARGLLAALVESHFSVDVVPDWKIEDYPLLVVPEWTDIGDEAQRALTEYARGGGRLLIAGAENARRFGPVLGVTLQGDPADRPAYVPGETLFGNARGLWQAVEPREAKVLAHIHPTRDFTRGAAVAATVSAAGKGQIAAIYGPIGSIFAATHAPATREFIAKVVRALFTPLVEVEAPPTVELVLRQKNGKRIAHLINATNMQVAANYAVTDFIPPVGPITLKYEGTRRTLERLHIHESVEL